MPQTADFSLLIQHPSPDIEPSTGQEIFTANIALRSLEELGPVGFINGEVILGQHVIDYMRDAVKKGAYRVEIVEGTTQYKLYRKFHEQAS